MEAAVQIISERTRSVDAPWMTGQLRSCAHGETPSVAEQGTPPDTPHCLGLPRKGHAWWREGNTDGATIQVLDSGRTTICEEDSTRLRDMSQAA